MIPGHSQTHGKAQPFQTKPLEKVRHVAAAVGGQAQTMQTVSDWETDGKGMESRPQ